MLLKSDASCIPGREELKTCHFLPMASVVHCSLAKLACEADLQCNSRWGVFVSECEVETTGGACSQRCNGLLAAATATPQGQSLKTCTCTEREDQLCIHLRENILGACTTSTLSSISPSNNSVTSFPRTENGAEPSASEEITFSSLLLWAIFTVRTFNAF
ncbi:hypothetical protein RB195_021015 [Necator americanus]